MNRILREDLGRHCDLFKYFPRSPSRSDKMPYVQHNCLTGSNRKQENFKFLFFYISEVVSSLQLTSYPEQTTANNILSPTSSFVQELSLAPLKRKYSFDNEYQDHSCHQMITPSWIIEQDEFIQQRDVLPSISMSSSNSSFSSSSDENIPIRTRSFMVAIKSTFERLKETSS